jgi:hypothetical protein
MRGIPIVESVTEHRGSFDHVAAWLLNCLDSLLPQPGGHLILYLCYHGADRSFFCSPQRNANLARALFNSYELELDWDGTGFGDLRFDLAGASREGPLTLTLRPPEHTAADGAMQATTHRPTMLEFQWNETESQVSPGTLSLLRHWVEPLSKDTLLRASLNIRSDQEISIARHIDLWQSHVRGPDATIFLPEGRTVISIGRSPGCDVQAPLIGSPLMVEYRSHTDEWNWWAPTAPWLPQGSKRGDVVVEYQTADGYGPVILTGQSWPARTLGEIAAANRLPRFLVQVVGCLLPKPSEKGDSDLVTGAKPGLGVFASSATELPEGAWLYLERNSSAPFLLREGEPPPGRRLRPHSVPEDLKLTIGAGPRRKGKWLEYSDELLPFFLGELRLMPPLSSRLVAEATGGDLPDEIFTQYIDSTLGRAPVRLETRDGRTYSLAFKPSAKHPVFVISKKRSEVMRYDPSDSSVINLGSGADFIFGATHYRLERLAEPAIDDLSANSLALPTGDDQ